MILGDNNSLIRVLLDIMEWSWEMIWSVLHFIFTFYNNLYSRRALSVIHQDYINKNYQMKLLSTI